MDQKREVTEQVAENNSEVARAGPQRGAVIQLYRHDAQRQWFCGIWLLVGNMGHESGNHEGIYKDITHNTVYVVEWTENKTIIGRTNLDWVKQKKMILFVFEKKNY